MKYDPIFQHLLANPHAQITLRCAAARQPAVRSAVSSALSKLLTIHNQIRLLQEFPPLEFKIHVTTGSADTLVVSTSLNPAAGAKLPIELEIIDIVDPTSGEHNET